ncbi:hypothetical protein PFMALIP_01106 [Plasmodium falciparum MaliPS096_E11]|uniref:Nudix hydrolase domain-containing protein n=1 Tax=Plasmodium falciparum MaliPS096_E11 TaxID=1036727 RepID=A0A024WUU5_PLAFA|nr:hypothetical protein PFMALIP_01106 [Plasmodium falciparum MaliPS096_E11]
MFLYVCVLILLLYFVLIPLESNFFFFFFSFFFIYINNVSIARICSSNYKKNTYMYYRADYKSNKISEVNVEHKKRESVYKIVNNLSLKNSKWDDINSYKINKVNNKYIYLYIHKNQKKNIFINTKKLNILQQNIILYTLQNNNNNNNSYKHNKLVYYNFILPHSRGLYNIGGHPIKNISFQYIHAYIFQKIKGYYYYPFMKNIKKFIYEDRNCNKNIIRMNVQKNNYNRYPNNDDKQDNNNNVGKLKYNYDLSCEFPDEIINNYKAAGFFLIKADINNNNNNNNNNNYRSDRGHEDNNITNNNQNNHSNNKYQHYYDNVNMKTNPKGINIKFLLGSDPLTTKDMMKIINEEEKEKKRKEGELNILGGKKNAEEKYPIQTAYRELSEESLYMYNIFLSYFSYLHYVMKYMLPSSNNNNNNNNNNQSNHQENIISSYEHFLSNNFLKDISNYTLQEKERIINLHINNLMIFFKEKGFNLQEYYNEIYRCSLPPPSLNKGMLDKKMNHHKNEQKMDDTQTNDTLIGDTQRYNINTQSDSCNHSINNLNINNGHCNIFESQVMDKNKLNPYEYIHKEINIYQRVEDYSKDNFKLYYKEGKYCVYFFNVLQYDYRNMLQYMNNFFWENCTIFYNILLKENYKFLISSRLEKNSEYEAYTFNKIQFEKNVHPILYENFINVQNYNESVYNDKNKTSYSFYYNINKNENTKFDSGFMNNLMWVDFSLILLQLVIDNERSKNVAFNLYNIYEQIIKNYYNHKQKNKKEYIIFFDNGNSLNISYNIINKIYELYNPFHYNLISLFKNKKYSDFLILLFSPFNTKLNKNNLQQYLSNNINIPFRKFFKRLILSSSVWIFFFFNFITSIPTK